VPEEQVCCAALHCRGIMDTARELAKKNIVAFEQAEVDASFQCFRLPPSSRSTACCSLTTRSLQNGSALQPKGEGHCVVFGQSPNLAKPGELKLRVAYDDPCHLIHAMKVSRQPRDVLRSIPGLELVELSTPEQCCGSAGIYNITNYELSMRILQRKIDDIRTTAADVVATETLVACRLPTSLQAGLDQIKVMHPVEVADQA
jgi:glycolate oxidase iron-sulfur subunit